MSGPSSSFTFKVGLVEWVLNRDKVPLNAPLGKGLLPLPAAHHTVILRGPRGRAWPGEIAGMTLASRPDLRAAACRYRARNVHYPRLASPETPASASAHSKFGPPNFGFHHAPFRGWCRVQTR
jgi:hypothetical protein